MGCSVSKELSTGPLGQQLSAPGGKPRKQSRRLTLAVEAETGYAVPQQEPSSHAVVFINRAGSTTDNRKEEASSGKASSSKSDSRQGQQGGTPAVLSELSRSLSPTRSRRLSHIYIAEQIAAPADGEQLEGQDSIDGSVAAWAPAEDSKSQPTPQVRKPLVRAQVACMSRAGCEPGYKKTNQDNCFAFEKYITEDQALFGAMDGHGPNGHFVSAFVKKHLPMILARHMISNGNGIGSQKGGSHMRQALHGAFLEVDGGLASNIDCEFSGCTCAVTHLQGRTLTTAWVGDSRMVLGRQKKKGWLSSWEAIDLSTDHKPNNLEEWQRIRNNNGRVERMVDEAGQPMGPYRVWLQDAWLPGLAMSRALGDTLAHSVGVTSAPQHMQLELTPADKVLVLASDGVWEFMTSKEAIHLVADCETPEEACRVLVNEAHSRWLQEEEGVVDDITAVVVKLLHQE